MPYEDLTDDEKLRFHDAVCAKHQECRTHIYYKQSALSSEEKALRDSAIDAIMHTAVNADDYKQPVNDEPTPTVEETAAALEGEN